jgi:transcriptional regulator with XRE-family HTH domain
MSGETRENFAVRFGESVRIFRQQKGISQEKLGELAQVDRKHISTIELGKQTTSIEIAYRIAQALDMPLSMIIKHAER